MCSDRNPISIQQKIALRGRGVHRDYGRKHRRVPSSRAIILCVASPLLTQLFFAALLLPVALLLLMAVRVACSAAVLIGRASLLWCGILLMPGFVAYLLVENFLRLFTKYYVAKARRGGAVVYTVRMGEIFLHSYAAMHGSPIAVFVLLCYFSTCIFPGGLGVVFSHVSAGI